jgi:hypothetical protein
MSRTQTLFALLLLTLATLSPRASGAQSLPASDADATLRKRIMHLADSNAHSVRIATRETRRIEGSGISLAGDSVMLETSSGVRAIPLRDVDSVWVQNGTAAPIVGVIAAVPCAIFGGMVGSFIGNDPDGSSSSRHPIILTLVGLVGGGAVCGAVGAGAGSAIKRWQLEFAR